MPFLCNECDDTATKEYPNEEHIGTNKLVVPDSHYHGGRQLNTQEHRYT